MLLCIRPVSHTSMSSIVFFMSFCMVSPICIIKGRRFGFCFSLNARLIPLCSILFHLAPFSSEAMVINGLGPIEVDLPFSIIPADIKSATIATFLPFGYVALSGIPTTTLFPRIDSTRSMMSLARAFNFLLKSTKE